jgi:EmrB/QacA subfamily drug resistance transporter
MPATLSILTNVFTNPAERARAIGLWAGVSGLGVAIGPLVGGYLLEHFWWGSIFLVNVPIVAVAVVAALFLVPESRDEHAPRLDVLGTLLSTVGLIALLYGVIEGPTNGWSDPLIVGCFLVAAVLLTGFVLWERHTDHPILDVTFFANPRFTAASVAVTLVFFAMFGSLFFVSQYLQFVLGYGTLEAGVRLLPIAAVLMISAPVSALLVARVGTKLVVSFGLLLVGIALFVFSRGGDNSGYGLVAVVLVIVGAGMGLAMAPATDSIMGSLPPEKAGVGSAMNDTTREIGGALGVAILGSIANAVYASRIESTPGFDQLAQAAPEAAQAVTDSVGSASVVAEQVPADVASRIVAAANDAFVHGMDRALIVGAVVAVLGAVVAYVFLPAHAAGDDALTELVEETAQRVGPEERRNLAEATLGLLAEAGMSSLTYNGIAARSGIGTATLERYWGSRVDAVADALDEVFDNQPVPDTGDLREDLRTFLRGVGERVADPRSHAVLGVLVSEGARDPELADQLRERIVEPRRRELATRLNQDHERLKVPMDVALDTLVGPLWYRAVIAGRAPDEMLVDALVDAVIS